MKETVDWVKANIIANPKSCVRNRKFGFTLAEGATHVDNFSKKRQFGFTLAEVLITLGIIGVVAALTISVLVKNYREKVLVTQLQKNYSLFSQVIRELSYEYGDDWDSVRIDNLFDDITSKVKTVKICRRTAGCFPSTPAKYLHSKGPATGPWNEQATYKFILQSGEFVKLSGSDNIANGFFIKKYPQYIMSIDINGLKAPNRVGRDIFTFGIVDGEFVPSGRDTDSAQCGSNQSYNGYGDYGYDCAFKVLKDGKFNY